MARLDHAIPISGSRLARRRKRARSDDALPPRRGDGLIRETFVLEREEAREKARAYLDRFPREAYWSRVEHWRQLPDGRIEFTMVRLPTAD